MLQGLVVFISFIYGHKKGCVLHLTFFLRPSAAKPETNRMKMKSSPHPNGVRTANLIIGFTCKFADYGREMISLSPHKSMAVRKLNAKVLQNFDLRKFLCAFFYRSRKWTAKAVFIIAVSDLYMLYYNSSTLFICASTSARSQSSTLQSAPTCCRSICFRLPTLCALTLASSLISLIEQPRVINTI